MIEIENDKPESRKRLLQSEHIFLIFAALTVVVVASLMGILFGGFDDSDGSSARSSAEVIAQACHLYKLRLGKYPEELDKLLKPPDGGPPILHSPPDIIDNWGHNFHYDPSGPHNKGENVDVWAVDPKTEKIIGNWEK
jgi:hypothetical protein